MMKKWSLIILIVLCSQSIVALWGGDAHLQQLVDIKDENSKLARQFNGRNWEIKIVWDGRDENGKQRK